MTSKSKRPSAEANIDELHAWATGETRTNAATKTATATATASAGMPARGKERVKRGLRENGAAVLPKVVVVIAVGLAAYLVFSFIIGLLMTMLMVAGGAALLYAAYRIGLWQGRRGK